MKFTDKERCCCFTGHRPEKMNMTESDAKRRIRSVLARTVAAGFNTYITGMAEGFDVWAAECVIEMKRENPDVFLVCAVPHTGFESRRSMREKERYRKIIMAADEVESVCGHYFVGCYQIRNEWMVDRSSLVIAAYSGLPSGTKNTVNYAERNGVRVINIL